MDEIVIALVVYFGALLFGLLLLTKEDWEAIFTRRSKPPLRRALGEPATPPRAG